MSTTLYRKYRSQTFADIVGQTSVVRILANSLKRDRLNHAYLFTGPRGTGKTSIARIFSKALNCPERKKGDACGVCEICESVANGNAVDVIEIDAASNRGVNEVKKALIESVGYAPLEFKTKVYIVDEVHMLSTTAFNSLLKTLEEPPSHVVFLLCTTEAHKLPATILSRCIRFDFSRLPRLDLLKHLQKIATLEGFSIGEEPAGKLADLAECSARDAISLLDQLMVYCDSEITSRDIQELFQLGDPALIPSVADQLVAGESQQVMGVWETLVEQGADPGRFLLRLAGEIKRRYLESGDNKYLRGMEAIWQGVNLLKYESFPALLVELTLLKAQVSLSGTAQVVQSQAAAQPTASAQRPQAAPQQPPPAPTAPATQASAPPAAVPERPWQKKRSAATPAAKPSEAKTAAPAAQPTAKAPAKPAAAKPHAPASSQWDGFLKELKVTRLTTFAQVAGGVRGKLTDSVFKLTFNKDKQRSFSYCKKDEHIDVLTALAKKTFGENVSVLLELGGAGGEVFPVAQSAVEDIKEQLPPELTSEMIEEPEAPANAADVNVDAMEKAAQDQHLDIGETVTKNDQAPTAQQVSNLFGGIELEKDE